MKDWVWGIDVSTKQADVCALNTDGRWYIDTWSWPPSGGPERLSLIWQEVAHGAEKFAEGHPPTMVYVELPTGSHPSPPLMMAAGAVAGATHLALCDLYEHPVSVHFVAVSAWKKHAIGHGNASKDQVMRWARSRGYEGSQDGADALAIATYSALDLARAA